MTLGVFPPPATGGGGGSTSPLSAKGDLWTYDTGDTRLPVGTNGYVLTADSTQTKGLKWAALPTYATSPLSVKGDLWTFSTVDAKLGVGSNGQVLTADSGQTTGLKWATPTASPLTTKGDLWVYGSADDRLPVGSNNQVLVADSGQSLGVKWSNPTGAITQIAQVVTSGSATTITFSSIPGSYNALKIHFKGRDVATGSGELFFKIQFNGDSTSGNYDVTQYIAGAGATASANTFAVSANGFNIGCAPGVSGNANAYGSAEITIVNYADTTFYKDAVSVVHEWFGATPTRADYIMAGTWKSTAAITSIVLTCSGTNFVNGTIATLYGLT